jgi:hypothetical protein
VGRCERTVVAGERLPSRMDKFVGVHSMLLGTGVRAEPTLFRLLSGVCQHVLVQVAEAGHAVGA